MTCIGDHGDFHCASWENAPMDLHRSRLQYFGRTPCCKTSMQSKGKLVGRSEVYCMLHRHTQYHYGDMQQAARSNTVANIHASISQSTQVKWQEMYSSFCNLVKQTGMQLNAELRYTLLHYMHLCCMPLKAGPYHTGPESKAVQVICSLHTA